MKNICFKLGLAIFLLAACNPARATDQASIADDKLAEIKARGFIVVATDPYYPPQSELLPHTSHSSGSKCEPTQYTANQFTGFDADVAKKIARGLDVEACFVTPPWGQLIAGNWQNNWDIHIGSAAITYDRMKVLYFSQPYYATPTVAMVHKDNTSIKTIEDLSGKRIGICAGCIFESYLKGDLKMPGQEITYRINNAKIIAYENETPSFADLALGDGVKLDAVITQLPVALDAVESTHLLKIIDKPLFFAYASVTVDRASRRDPENLLAGIDQIIKKLHDNGTLSTLSTKYHGIDLTKEAAQFNLSLLQQFP